MSHSYDKTTSHICPACSYGPFTRNNYFTGKLMVERDFTDETRYHMEKLRHHEQVLHGWGVVCGLKVKPHPNEACRDRFVCVEPGSAVDCCGHDIIVAEEDCIDITELPAIAELGRNKDLNPHTLQICLRFRECPTEEIPVLYDDCGCDDTKCAPNRILESYEIDVTVDAPAEPPPLHTPKLEWANSIAIAHAGRAALHDGTHRLYVATADAPSTVYQVSTDNHATITSRALPAAAFAMAVSNDGKHLYVVTGPVSPVKVQQLHALDTTQVGMPDFNTKPIDIPNSAGSDVALAVAPDGRLLALVLLTGDILRWGTDLDTNVNPAAPVVVKNLGANVRGLVLSSNGKITYSLGPNQEIQALDIAAALVTAIKVLPAGAKPSALAVIASTGPDMLAVCDQTSKQFHLVALDPAPELIHSVSLDHSPIDLVVSPGGHWSYVLEKDPAGSFVQTVDIDRLHLKLPVVPGAPFKVGNDSRQIVVSKSGAHLYIPYVDDLANPTLGGVAIVDVSEQACEEIVWRHLEGCPHCDLPNCVVLATIENYRFGDRIEGQTDPPTDPADKIARINNRLGRRLLPSTEVLYELIECLSEHGTGGAGQQGPPGQPGKNGTNGTNGKDGAGLELGLTRIEALSWTHNQAHNPSRPPSAATFLAEVTFSPSEAPKVGIVIGFTGDVDTSTIDGDHVFQILVPSASGEDAARGVVCHCAIQPVDKTTYIVPVNFDLDANGRIKVNAKNRIDKATFSVSPKARGVAYILDPSGRPPVAEDIVFGLVPDLWIVLRGDFVLDAQRRAIDAEFARAELPTGDRAAPPAGQPLKDQLGIQGGTFESWFTINRQPIRGRGGNR